MVELLESAANLHRIAVDLRNEGRKKHAKVLLKTIELELAQILGGGEDEKIQDGYEGRNSSVRNSSVERANGCLSVAS
jgi:hypothetical protein